LSTVSTGGFCIRNDNLESYHSFGIESIVVIFMLLGSLHFALYYSFLRGQWRRFKDPELFTYLLTIFFFGALLVYNLMGVSVQTLHGTHETLSFKRALETGFYQLVSAISSTGFTLGDYDDWPFFSQGILMLAMFLGGMSGSTAGGLKMVRAYLLTGLVKNKMEQVLRPETVRAFHLGATPIQSQVATTIFTYFLLVVVGTICGTLVYLFAGMDPETAFSMSASMINNSGLAFRAAGPLGSAALLTPFYQYFSCFLMVIGRLEFFVICILFLPQFWRPR
jgi:trk system potassium uptake protein